MYLGAAGGGCLWRESAASRARRSPSRSSGRLPSACCSCTFDPDPCCTSTDACDPPPLSPLANLRRNTQRISRQHKQEKEPRCHDRERRLTQPVSGGSVDDESALTTLSVHRPHVVGQSVHHVDLHHLLLRVVHGERGRQLHVRARAGRVTGRAQWPRR